MRRKIKNFASIWNVLQQNKNKSIDGKNNLKAYYY